MADNPVVTLRDENGNPVPTGSSSSPVVHRIEDGVGTQLATVGQQHNADFQVPPAAGGALLTAGVPQLQDVAGLQDRQRAAGADAISALGLTASAANFAQAVGPYQLGTAVVAGQGTPASPKVITPSSMVNVLLGATLTVDSGANLETAVVVAVTSTTASLVFGPNGALFTHAGTITFTTFVYNQERDASGELDGASGKGTAVAAEYEYNSSTYDRARNLQGKGVVTSTLNGAANSGQNLATLAAGPVPQVGQPVYFQGGTAEVGYVLSVAGQVLTLVSNLVNTHGTGTNVQWDTYAGPVGPGLSGFLPTGVGIEEEALYDPVSGLYYVERSATQDNAATQNVVMENEALYNGVGFDRARTNLAVALGAQTAAFTSPDQLNVNGHALHVITNLTTLTGGTSPSITVTVNGKSASGVYYPLLVGAAIAAVGTQVLKIGPALTAAANSIANDWVPRTFQVVVTVAGAPTGLAYTVDYNLSE